MTRHRHTLSADDGYTLIGLLALMIVSSILMATIAPTWGYLVQRDREEELIFRGESYARAIERYQTRFNTLPTRLEDLTKYNMIRKLYKDPVSDDRDFELILQGPDGRKRESELTKSQQEGLRGSTPGRSSLGIVGVVSTSDEIALRPYNEKERYNEWEFIAGEGEDETPEAGGDDDESDDDEEGDEPDRRGRPQ